MYTGIMLDMTGGGKWWDSYHETFKSEPPRTPGSAKVMNRNLLNIIVPAWRG